MVVEVDMHRRNNEITVIVLDVREFLLNVVRVMVVNQGDGPGDLGVASGLSVLDQLVADHVRHGEGAIGVPLFMGHGVELLGEIARQGNTQPEDGLSFHGSVPRTLCPGNWKGKGHSATRSVLRMRSLVINAFSFPARSAYNSGAMRVFRSLLALLALLPLSAAAHPGHGTASLGEGLAHPLSGLDHLLAMVAVGLWAAQLGGRARWVVPGAFVSAMAAGWGLGMLGVPIPGVEQGIVASVLVLGLMIAIAARPPIGVPVAMVAAFALFHGHAHGTEAAPGGSALAYALGFTTATVFLHLAGIGLGQALESANRARPWLRLAGGSVALAGLMMAIR